jgi:hypothetical protein
MPTNGNPVVWFEIPVKDLERATKFYESLLGVQLTRTEMGPLKMAMFPWVENAAGAAGALVMSQSYVPSHDGALVYFSVGDIDAMLAKVHAGGGITLMPRTGIGEYGFIAQFEDSEGNRVALHSMSG